MSREFGAGHLDDDEVSVEAVESQCVEVVEDFSSERRVDEIFFFHFFNWLI